MVQTLHTFANILDVCIHKKCAQNVSTEITLASQQWINSILVSSERYPCLLRQQTNVEEV